ncbi:MAG: hypothetical protein AAF515_05110 [Pseudomonadota bacterium]
MAIRPIVETVVRGSSNPVSLEFRLEPRGGGRLQPASFVDVVRLEFGLANWKSNPIYVADQLDGQGLVDRTIAPGWLDVVFGLMPDLPRGLYTLRMAAYHGSIGNPPEQVLHETLTDALVQLRIVDP